MGSAAFLNETINQLAEAYISRKEQELGQVISYENRFNELQKVKMYIADRNVYGIDLNPIAVELAEVSLWLNTIHEGGFVPWFGTQLVNGNSLIGARRQVYRIDSAQAASKGLRWFENEPERLPFGTARADKGYKFGRKQIYHFLLGDPGMCSYSDKDIKSLEPNNIKKMVNWNKKFTAPITDDDVITLLRLSETIDDLWDAQIKLRKEVGTKTQDALSIFGHADDAVDSHTTIRQKDKIYSELYKSEHMKNAGPYARLKFAMDYWCSLWFWPIDQADLLPSRSEFLFDMSLILEGTTDSVLVTDSATDKKQTRGQLSLFPTEMQQLEMEILDSYAGMGEVDISALRKKNPRLDLVARIAEQNKFMHWELEFADLFAERGGFDLIIGNPPWVKITWEEKGVLSDEQPLFAVRNLSAAQTMQRRDVALRNSNARAQYFIEYETISAQQSYINSTQNYAPLKGLQGNLYECFLPQSWRYCNLNGVFALIHPESVFNDSKGTEIRRELNSRLRKHFRFSNALKLFADVHPSREYGLNVYSNKLTVGFDQIVNLYAASTIDECYENDDKLPVCMRDENGKRNLKGQRSRITSIGKKELKLFSRILDDSDDWASARLMSVYAEELIAILSCFDKQEKKLADLGDQLSVSMLWDETNAQKDGTIERNVHFGDRIETILSGTHIGTANPLFNCSNEGCTGNNDNTSIDLTSIPVDYLQRSNYSPSCTIGDYLSRIPDTPWGKKYTDHYRIAGRKMIDIEGERTLMTALIPPQVGHTNGIIGFAFADTRVLALMLGAFCSLPYDFFIKVCGKSNLQMNTAGMLPLIDTKHQLADEIICRIALLNCLSEHYSSFWKDAFNEKYTHITWSKNDQRLKNEVYTNLSREWSYNTPVRGAYERRQLMVEIDVLVAMVLGMTLDQLLAAYCIQFPILQQHEKDTFYDSVGKIVFAKNNALTGVGVDRKTWENLVVPLSAGEKYSQMILDGTMPGGPIERTIEYVAPFDRCDREKDYKTAWKFFEEKYTTLR